MVNFMARPSIFRSTSRRRGLQVLVAAVASWAILLGGLLFGGPAVRAADDPAASAWFETDQGKVRLIAAAPRVGEGDTVRLGLEFQLEAGWKVYWRSPGDAGL